MIRGHTFMTSTKNDQYCEPLCECPIPKNEQQTCHLKTTERANTGLITRSSPIPCGCHKCMVPLMISSKTCSNFD